VYSFLAAPSAPVASNGTVTGLIQESNADITSQGVLSYQYAAKVSCVLSQKVDRWVRFGKIPRAPSALLWLLSYTLLYQNSAHRVYLCVLYSSRKKTATVSLNSFKDRFYSGYYSCLEEVRY
jgi:hypothetical protein